MTMLFRTEYGSRAMGMATEDSDHDIMEVHLEPRQAITGLDTYKATHKSTAGNSRSGPDDTDTVRYGLKKWATLAARGNPTALTPLWVPEDMRSYDENLLGATVMDNWPMFVSKDAVRQSVGYSRAQFDALQGLRNKKTNRPELIHKHGYDTKFAYHALRTLMQAHELASTGQVRLPITGPQYNLLHSIRRGKMPKSDFLEVFGVYWGVTERVLPKSDLPEHANREGINDLLHDIYMEGWQYYEHED